MWTPRPDQMIVECLEHKNFHNVLYTRVGWFWTFFTFSTKVPLRFVAYLPKVPKIAKKCFDPVTSSSLVTTFWVMHYIRVQHFFFTIWTSWVSKDAEFYVEFKIVNSPYWQNAPKKVIQEKRISLQHRGPPVYWQKSLSWKCLFWGAFCH
jgi:hypothetical protein